MKYSTSPSGAAQMVTSAAVTEAVGQAWVDGSAVTGGKKCEGMALASRLHPSEEIDNREWVTI